MNGYTMTEKYHKICEVLDNRLLRYIDTISEGGTEYRRL